jgi:sulfatase modifying factor 1
MIPLCRLETTFLVALLFAILATPKAHAVSFDMVTVGNPGNLADEIFPFWGRVNYEYRIGTHEVTIGQYAAFLTAVAATDTYGLYNPNMASNLNTAGITRSGTSGSYSYTVVGPAGITPAGASSPANRPVTYVSWFNAARFANWVANGQPSGPQDELTTEDGAYTLFGTTTGASLARNAVNPNTNLPPTYWLPSHDEWYKAAYYDPTLTSGQGGYYLFPTRSNSPPGNLIGTSSNQANYRSDSETYSVTRATELVADQNYLTDVGAFSGSPSFYGTFDQAGNVWEWTDTDLESSTYIRGGGWTNPGFLALQSNFNQTVSASFVQDYLGFRLAAAVPEPSTCLMALAGLACGGSMRFRRHRVLGGLNERHVQQRCQPAARLDLGAGPVGVVGPGLLRVEPVDVLVDAPDRVHLVTPGNEENARAFPAMLGSETLE